MLGIRIEQLWFYSKYSFYFLLTAKFSHKLFFPQRKVTKETSPKACCWGKRFTSALKFTLHYVTFQNFFTRIRSRFAYALRNWAGKL